MTIETVEVILYSVDYYEFTGPAARVLSQIQTWISMAPAEFRDSVEIKLDIYDDYGSPSCGGGVYYTRPKTPEELLKRQLDQKAYYRRAVAEAEANLARARKLAGL